MVQVTTDAKASPIITAFTRLSAFMNIPQGERSRGSRDERSGAGWAGGSWIASGAGGREASGTGAAAAGGLLVVAAGGVAGT